MIALYAVGTDGSNINTYFSASLLISLYTFVHKHTQCSDGCRLWKAALDSSCQTQCVSTRSRLQPSARSSFCSPFGIDPQSNHTTTTRTSTDGDDQLLTASLYAHLDDDNELYCELACNDALNAYFGWLVGVVGTPAAPVLVADTLTPTALSLEWTIPPRLVALSGARPLITRSYLVQWRYEEMAGDWTLCRNQSIAGDNSTVHVENLHPYTKYRVSEYNYSFIDISPLTKMVQPVLQVMVKPVLRVWEY